VIPYIWQIKLNEQGSDYGVKFRINRNEDIKIMDSRWPANSMRQPITYGPTTSVTTHFRGPMVPDIMLVAIQDRAHTLF
jgi:hypothetical protein